MGALPAAMLMTKFPDALSDAAPDASPPRPRGRLRAGGTALVDASGQRVLLRGVNLGGWLFHETGITGLDLPDSARAHLAADSDLPLRQLLERRFGADGRDRPLDRFQAAWIRDADVAWLADAGFNLVRIPIGYRSLVTASDPAPPAELVWNERCLSRPRARPEPAARGSLARRAPPRRPNRRRHEMNEAKGDPALFAKWNWPDVHTSGGT